MPSGTAQRPSDVITIRGGKTVEVLNTDAEGRLVMADGLVAAIEENPDVVLDIATLTGAQMVALGTPRLAPSWAPTTCAARSSPPPRRPGEQFWPMPLPGASCAPSSTPRSPTSRTSATAFGGMLIAGLFLREFVGGTPWAHLDIAGPAFNEKSAHGYTPVGGHRRRRAHAARAPRGRDAALRGCVEARAGRALRPASHASRGARCAAEFQSRIRCG